MVALDFNGKYLVNISLSELESFKVKKLDIFRKYKHYLRQIEAQQDKMRQMQEQLNQKK